MIQQKHEKSIVYMVTKELLTAVEGNEMERYFIGYDEHSKNIETSLACRARESMGEKFAYFQEEIELGDISFLDITLLPAAGNKFNSVEEFTQLARKKFFHAVAVSVVDDMRLGEIRRMLMHWPGLSWRETEQLALQSNGRILKMQEKIRDWVNEAEKQIESLMLDNNEIYLPGFIAFRIKDMSSQWRGSVEYVLESLLIEREYQEFIKLLQCFVEMQEAKLDVVNVIPVEGAYILMDENYNIISADYTAGLTTDDMRGEDLLISSLINIAPTHIYVYNKQNANAQMMDTIDKVFVGRVEFMKNGQYKVDCIDKAHKDEV